MSDLISRQAAIDKINERQRKLIYCFGFENDAVKIMDVAKSIISAIPSAQPIKIRARWLHSDDLSETLVCSACGYDTEDYEPYTSCPNCGAMMVDGDDSITQCF